MKLLSFAREGRTSVGALAADGRVIDLTQASAGRLSSMKEALGDLEATRTWIKAGAPSVELDALVLLPPVPDPQKILCVGVNYDEHRKETGRSESAYPVLFTRFTNTLIPHRAPLLRPKVSETFDFEGEMAVVIGRRARRVAEHDALNHVGGYACFVDATLRDWQRHTHQFTPGKNFPSTGAFGPWITTADEIPDPQALELVTRLNGTEVQRSSTSAMIFSVAALIAYISEFTELVPGDVIATGTPSGVGFAMKPPVFLRPGDVVECAIEGIGAIRNRLAVAMAD